MSGISILDGSGDYVEGGDYLLYHLLTLCIFSEYTCMFWKEGDSKTFATTARDDAVELFEHPLTSERAAMASGLTRSVRRLCDAEHSAKSESAFVLKLQGESVRVCVNFEHDADAGSSTIRLRPQVDPASEIVQSARESLQSFVRRNRHMALDIKGTQVVHEYIDPNNSAGGPWTTRILRRVGQFGARLFRRETDPHSASEKPPV
jgi:hypothetical protein